MEDLIEQHHHLVARVAKLETGLEELKGLRSQLKDHDEKLARAADALNALNAKLTDHDEKIAQSISLMSAHNTELSKLSKVIELIMERTKRIERGPPLFK